MSRLPNGRRPEGRRPTPSARRPSLEPLEPKALLAVFTVTSNADPNEITAGTLRWAIEQANAADGLDSIAFNLPSGQRTIAVTRALPPISSPLTIDGTTQPGFDPGDPLPVVEVTYGSDTGAADGFRIRAGGSTIRGLAITDFPGNGISILNADDNRIENNFIGLRIDTQAAAGNEGHGILIQSSSRNRIGGEPTRGNRIVANGQASGANGVTIEGPNESIDNRITFNSISQSGGLGIDLGNDGVTANDAPPDADTGPNNRQNFPEITFAATIESFFATPRTEIQATLRSRPNTTFLVQFFDSGAADPSGFGEGDRLLLSRQVSTDATGIVNFVSTLFNTVAPGRFITATATDPRGNTSEFSGAREVLYVTDRVDVGLRVNATPDPVDAGQQLRYSAVVSNFNFDPGTSSAPVELVVQLPDDVTLNPADVVISSGTFEITGNVLRVSFGPLAGQQSETLDFRVIPTRPGLVQSIFSVTGGIADPDTSNNQATVVTQVNLNPQTPVLSFRIREFTVGESGGQATIEVVRSNAAAGTVTVDYRTVDGSAVAGTNYVATTGTLTFGNNELFKTFTVPIIDNDQLDPNRTLTVELLNPSLGSIVGDPARATLIIYDNDPPTPAPQYLQFAQAQVFVPENQGRAEIVVRRVGGSAGVVSIPFATAPGTALAGRDFGAVSGTLTFASGEVEKTITVPLIDNAAADGNRSFRVELGAGIGAAPGDPRAVEVTIVDDESPALGVFQFLSSNFDAVETDGVATITVTRAGGIGPATISFAATPGTAAAGVRFVPTSGTLEFAEGETSKTFTVALIETPGFVEPQTVNLSLSVPDGAELGGIGRATLTIIDAEAPPASLVRFGVSQVVVDESSGVATLTINRVGLAIGTISVNVSTRAGDAVPGVHYQPIDTRLEFGPGETSKTVSIPILDNDLFDADRALGIFLEDPEGNALLGDPNSAVVIIRNDDPDPVVPIVADVSSGGAGAAISSLTLTFNKPMDPATLLAAGNYAVIAHGRDGVLGTADDRAIAIAGLELAPGGTGVTILLASPVRAGEFVSLIVNGGPGGPADSSGNLIDGDGDGVAGGGFSAALARGARFTYRDHDGDLITYAATGGGLVEVVRGAPGSGDVLRVLNPVPGRTVLRGQVVRQRGGDGLAFIRRIEGIDPFGRVRSALRTPRFVDLSQLSPAAVDALIAGLPRPVRR